MLRSRKFGRFCAIVTALSFLLTGAFVYASQSGLIEKASAEGYSKRLFEPSRVHSIDIVMDDWDGFIENCTDEEYVSCTVLIDGEKSFKRRHSRQRQYVAFVRSAIRERPLQPEA